MLELPRAVLVCCMALLENQEAYIPYSLMVTRMLQVDTTKFQR
jgi:hypothetical protein